MDEVLVFQIFTEVRRPREAIPLRRTLLEKLGVNGPPLTVSDTTDRFAPASVMFEVESDAKPNLTLVHSSLGFPVLTTGNESLHSLIVKAWRAGYLMIMSIRSTTFPMLFNSRTNKP